MKWGSSKKKRKEFAASRICSSKNLLLCEQILSIKKRPLLIKAKVVGLLLRKVYPFTLILLHSEWQKLYGVLAVCSSVGLILYIKHILTGAELRYYFLVKVKVSNSLGAVGVRDPLFLDTAD